MLVSLRCIFLILQPFLILVPEDLLFLIPCAGLAFKLFHQCEIFRLNGSYLLFKLGLHRRIARVLFKLPSGFEAVHCILVQGYELAVKCVELCRRLEFSEFCIGLSSVFNALLKLSICESGYLLQLNLSNSIANIFQLGKIVFQFDCPLGRSSGACAHELFCRPS